MLIKCAFCCVLFNPLEGASNLIEFFFTAFDDILKIYWSEISVSFLASSDPHAPNWTVSSHVLCCECPCSATIPASSRPSITCNRLRLCFAVFFSSCAIWMFPWGHWFAQNSKAFANCCHVSFYRRMDHFSTIRIRANRSDFLTFPVSSRLRVAIRCNSGNSRVDCWVLSLQFINCPCFTLRIAIC